MNKMAELLKLSDEIEGFLGRREGPYLYRLAQFGIKLGVVVEIGSWKGKSTVWLAKGMESVGGGEIFAIDPHIGGDDFVRLGYTAVNTVEEFKNNINRAGVGSLVRLVQKPSLVAVQGWSQGIGLLWIDGDHGYNAVSADFYQWESHVVDGGVVAFHDTYSWEGVRTLVDREVLVLPNYRVLGQVDGILAVQKVKRLSRLDVMQRNIVLHLRQTFNRARVQRRHWRALPRKVLRGLSRPRL
jgi:predicted O-methyltransferase YrrM